MIDPADEDFIRHYACIPEHLPAYGTAVSGAEAFCDRPYLHYWGNGVLIFIGYPLGEPFDEERMDGALGKEIERRRPNRVALISPAISRRSGDRAAADRYYRLDLDGLKISPKVDNMIRRGSREVEIEEGRRWTDGHQRLVAEFLDSREADEETRRIFARIPAYLAAAPTARLFTARGPNGEAVAFDVGEFGARQYAFYMFNFRSRRARGPGVSDLLLAALVREAVRRGKIFVNLGLGINPGVAFFKKKWGALPFLGHERVTFRPRPPSFFESLTQGIFRS